MQGRGPMTRNPTAAPLEAGRGSVRGECSESPAPRGVQELPRDQEEPVLCDGQTRGNGKQGNDLSPSLQRATYVTQPSLLEHLGEAAADDSLCPPEDCDPPGQSLQQPSPGMWRHSGQPGGGQTSPRPHRAQRQGRAPDRKWVDMPTPCQEHRGRGARALRWAGQAIPGEVRLMLRQQEEPAPGEEHSWQANGISEGSEAGEGLRASAGAEGGRQRERALDRRLLAAARLRQASAPRWASDSSSVAGAGEGRRGASTGKPSRQKNPRPSRATEAAGAGASRLPCIPRPCTF